MSEIISFKSPCTFHGHEFILMNLTDTEEQINRLFCKKCNCNDQNNLITPDKVLEFLEKAQELYSSINQAFENSKQALATIKDKILNYLKDLESQFEQLRTKFEQTKWIKDQELQYYLQRDKQFHKDELIRLAVLLSKNTLYRMKNDEASVTFKNDPSNMYEQQLFMIFTQQAFPLQNFLGQLHQQLSTSYENDHKQFQEVQKVQLKCQILSMSFSKSGSYLAVGTNKTITDDKQDSYVQVWKNENQQHKFTLQQQLSHKEIQKDVSSVYFNSVDDSLLIGTLNGVIQSWSYEQTQQKWMVEEKQEFKGHEHSINCITIDSQSNWIASSCSQIILWMKNNDNLWEKMFEFNDHGDNKVSSLSFCQDCQLLVSGGSDQQIIVFKFVNGKWLNSQTIRKLPVKFVAFIDCDQFFSIDHNKRVTYWIWNKEDQKYQQDGNNMFFAIFQYQNKLYVNKKIFQMNQQIPSLAMMQQLTYQNTCCQISPQNNTIAFVDKLKNLYFFQE